MADQTKKAPCLAIVDDMEHLAYYAPRQGLVQPGSKPCSHEAKETVGHLRLCATHARMAREGLIMESGRVADREDIRNVRRYPKKFPHGLYSWVRKLGEPSR